MQSKLLRVIQERSVRPVGAVAETPVNVRMSAPRTRTWPPKCTPAASGRTCSTA